MSLRPVSCPLVARPLGVIVFGVTLPGVTPTVVMLHVILTPAYGYLSFRHRYATLY